MKAALVVLFLIGLIAASSCHQATSSSISVDDFRQVEREDARAGKYMAFYELAQELAEKVESKRSTEQSECRVLTGLRFCNMIDYPTAGDPAFDELLFQSANDSFNDDTDCNLSYKALICTMFYRGCEVTADGFRNLPTCRSQCIDFTTKCAAFYTGGFCTDPRVYAPDDSTVTRCSKALVPPSPTCSVPVFDTGACAAYVTYTTPTGPNPVINAQLGELTSAYFAYLNATIDVALSEQTTTPEQANICFLTYQRMLCRYIFLECTGDPFQININCELNCQDLYFSCPFMRPDGYEPPADGEIDDSCGLVLPGCKPLPVGFTYGDPHFNTLDGAPFEFNGLGEFIIAETTDSDAVQVQARFEKCNSNGDATCTTAAGLQGYGHSVRLYSGSSAVTVRVDSETLNIDSTQWPYSVANGDIVILRESGTQNFEVQTKNGLSFQYRLQEGFTMIAVGAGSGLRNKLKGFYGNFDGLRANDFETRAGTIVNFPPTASETFTWGKTWRVSESESVFDYDGKTYADINDASFVPSFSDSGMTFSGAATTACADLSEQFYRSCLFDVTVTGDVNFARASALAQERIAELTPVDNTPIDGYEPQAEEPSGATTVQVAAAVIVCSLLTMMY